MMDEVITFVGIAFVLAITVVAGYCCLIQGARQDEISQKDWEEFEKSEKQNWEE